MSDLRVSVPKPCDEPWEKMAPAGCDRICARCDKVIHDLSNYELDEAEALLRRGSETCVRVRIGADGAVALKPGRSMRRMMVAAAASAGLAASVAGCVQPDRRDGSISGRVSSFGLEGGRVTMTGPNGEWRSQRLKPGGRYEFTRLRPGTYKLTFNADCAEKPWTVENIVVGGGETLQPDIENPEPCIYVGQMMIEDDGPELAGRSAESEKRSGGK